jgi:hypothetical protein
MNILDNLKDEEQDWLVLIQKIYIPTFLSLNLKCSLYRSITNSRRKFRNTTNREFFRSNFSEGFYRSTILNNQFQYTYFLKTKHNIDKHKILTELKLRMKKIVYSNIEILNLSESELSIPVDHVVTPLMSYFVKTSPLEVVRAFKTAFPVPPACPNAAASPPPTPPG